MGQYSFEAVIFDLDGVVTKTAVVHARAWKIVFDDYLRTRSERRGKPAREFTNDDYLVCVDGKPRYQGVKSFLDSVGVEIPFGDPSDPPDAETVCGIGNRKNSIFREVLKRKGVNIYPSTITLIKSLTKAGIRVGVASSSKNCELILTTADIDGLFETRVDGVVSAELGLVGKPEGDIFVKAAENLGSLPGNSVVVEDATSGVQAGRNGGFGLVLGVARKNNESDLLENGADIVVRDMEFVDIGLLERWFQKKPRFLFKCWDNAEKESGLVAVSGKDKNEILVNPCQLRAGKESFTGNGKLVFFLDYDGTLTPIVSRPDLAILSDEMRQVVEQLSRKHMVAIVSGRMREDVENLVRIKELFYAGSHGFDISGPGFTMVEPEAKETMPVIADITKQLKKELGDIPGALIEEKKFSVAAHYRLVEERHIPRMQEVVNRIVGKYDSVRLMSGKKVFEILPNIDWNKGKAIRWIMQALKISWDDSSVFYIGDDVTDEDAFRMVRTRGTGILVAEAAKTSAADFQLSSPGEVKKLFEEIAKLSS